MSSPQISKVKSTPKASASQVVPTWPPKSPYTGRNGLGAYIASPSKYPAVIYQNEKFVAIYDGFPKSSVHVLLLPRDPTKTLLHPFDAFEDLQFLEEVKVETRKLKSLVASELRRKYGKTSAAERARIEAMEVDPPLDTLPPGRDWEKDVISGIHIGPSMNHLHIHVLSVDRYSPCLKHRKHYNSFSTPFLLDVEDFPLSAEDPRRSREHGYLKSDFICWRCGHNFGNKFSLLKDHLAKEYEEWKRE
jgi:aprataxin